MHELILGGARSGKSACAERRARDWMAQGGSAALIATALPADEEMRLRIERHQHDRAARAPGLATLEEHADLPGCLRRASRTDRLLVVDCLTLWLSQCLMPPPGQPVRDARSAQQALCEVLVRLPGPVVMVSNEVGSGLMPMGREVRAVVDALGTLHQAVAQRCARLTLMVAGHELRVK